MEREQPENLKAYGENMQWYGTPGPWEKELRVLLTSNGQEAPLTLIGDKLGGKPKACGNYMHLPLH